VRVYLRRQNFNFWVNTAYFSSPQQESNMRYTLIETNCRKQKKRKDKKRNKQKTGFTMTTSCFIRSTTAI